MKKIALMLVSSLFAVSAFAAPVDHASPSVTHAQHVKHVKHAKHHKHMRHMKHHRHHIHHGVR